MAIHFSLSLCCWTTGRGFRRRNPTWGGLDAARAAQLRQYIHRPWRIISKLEVGRRSEDYAMTCWAAEQWYSITAVANHLPARSSYYAAAMPPCVACVYYIRRLYKYSSLSPCHTARERRAHHKINLNVWSSVIIIIIFPSLLESHNSRVTLLLREKSHLHTLMPGHNTSEATEWERRENLRAVTKELCRERICACATWKLKFRRLFHSSPLSFLKTRICSSSACVFARLFSFSSRAARSLMIYAARGDVFAKWLWPEILAGCDFIVAACNKTPPAVPLPTHSLLLVPPPGASQTHLACYPPRFFAPLKTDLVTMATRTVFLFFFFGTPTSGLSAFLRTQFQFCTSKSCPHRIFAETTFVCANSVISSLASRLISIHTHTAAERRLTKWHTNISAQCSRWATREWGLLCWYCLLVWLSVSLRVLFACSAFKNIKIDLNKK